MAVVEVVCQHLKNNPACPHGPTLKFVRIKNGVFEEFFACSTYRNRKDCSFFLPVDKHIKVTEKNKSSYGQHMLPSIDHAASETRLCEVKSVMPGERLYCHTCCQLDLDSRRGNHIGHSLQSPITDLMLHHPSQMLKPKEDSKKEAQYLFSERTSKVIVENLQRTGVTRVLCLGTPRIHEYIHKNKTRYMESLLLDLDYRYHSFWTSGQFVWFNMFNRHILSKNSKLAKHALQKFLSVKCQICLVLDPPFGGHVEAIAATVYYFSRLVEHLKVIWVFPYFRERHILKHCPSLTMLDYKVQYENHKEFNNGVKGRKLGSPVRLFTNIDLSEFVLPCKEGYRMCSTCQRWVAEENKHCLKCNNCPSKDGRTYIHCDRCQTCVKPQWTHCVICRRCLPSEHLCHSNVPDEDSGGIRQFRHKKLKISQEKEKQK